jgi:hypothetical protein
MSRLHAILRRFQAQLESIHAVRVPGHVEDFLCTRELVAQLRGEVRAPEELLISQDDDGLSVGLYIAPEVLTSLARQGSPLSLLLGERLPAYCVAAEGVSHWLYLHHRAGQDGPLSQLELEVQAEVDKFASCTLGLWQLGLLGLCSRLRERLFDGVRYFAHLDPAERERYVTANQLARRYAAHLEKRFVEKRDLEGFLRALRFAFRLSGGEKYAYLSAA